MYFICNWTKKNKNTANLKNANNHTIQSKDCIRTDLKKSDPIMAVAVHICHACFGSTAEDIQVCLLL